MNTEREKIGRNERCPCGSGKKYKQCCLPKAERAASEWQRSHNAFDRVQRDITSFARRRFSDLIEFAWTDFQFEDPDKSFDDSGPQMIVFMPYFIFRWRPPGKNALPSGDATIAHAFLRQSGGQLNDLEKLVVEFGLTQPITFYETISVRPGADMTVKELFTGETATVVERAATQFLHPGDMLYAQMAPMPGMVLMAFSSMLIFPARFKVDMVELRQWIRAQEKGKQLTRVKLLKYEEEIRALYLRLHDLLFARPKLANTDGELIEFHTITYEIGSAQVGFDALSPLAWGITKEDLLAEATRDREGNLSKVGFPWQKKGNRMHKEWDNTILGKIQIEDRKLVVEVNSVDRAEKIRKQIEKRLGLAAEYKGTKIKTQDDLSKSRTAQPARSRDDEKPPDDPLVREKLRELTQKQLDDWATKKIPALGGRTPMQAVKDPAGRELVEALLDGYADTLQKNFPDWMRPDISMLRRKLKFDK